MNGAMADLQILVALSSVPQLEHAFSRLESYFRQPEDAWKAGSITAKRVRTGLADGPEVGQASRATIHRLDLTGWRGRGFRRALERDGYPPRLKEIPDPPPVPVLSGRNFAGGRIFRSQLGDRRNPTSLRGGSGIPVLSRDLCVLGITW